MRLVLGLRAAVPRRSRPATPPPRGRVWGMPSASSPAEPSPVRQVGAVWVGIGGCSSLDPPYGKTNLELSFPGDANLHFTSTSEVTRFGVLPNRHPRDGANTNCWDAAGSCSCTPQQHQVRRQNGSCQLFLCVLSSHPSDFFFFPWEGRKKTHLCSYLLHRRDWKGPLCPSCWVHGAKPREGGYGTARWQLGGKREPS